MILSVLKEGHWVRGGRRQHLKKMTWFVWEWEWEKKFSQVRKKKKKEKIRRDR
jgi:hypothetical protein